MDTKNEVATDATEQKLNKRQIIDGLIVLQVEAQTKLDAAIEKEEWGKVKKLTARVKEITTKITEANKIKERGGGGGGDKEVTADGLALRLLNMFADNCKENKAILAEYITPALVAMFEDKPQKLVDTLEDLMFSGYARAGLNAATCVNFYNDACKFYNIKGEATFTADAGVRNETQREAFAAKAEAEAKAKAEAEAKAEAKAKGKLAV